MSGEIELLEGEFIVAELTAPDDYINHRNQVVCVTNQRLIYLKKKTIGAYYVIEYIPLSDCTEIIRKEMFALWGMIGGIFLASIGLLVFIFALTGQLANFSAAIYGIPLVGIGASLIFGVKRHKLQFHCGNQTYSWVSPAGSFKAIQPAIIKLYEFAMKRNIVITELET